MTVFQSRTDARGSHDRQAEDGKGQGAVAGATTSTSRGCSRTPAGGEREAGVLHRGPFLG